MLNQNEMKSIHRLVETENKLIKEFEILVKQAKEPQLKNDFEVVLASHKNHLKYLNTTIDECTQQIKNQ